ncbi:MAG: Protein translocase membrane subunit SecG, partial [uncultured Frankineae bacterium]
GHLPVRAAGRHQHRLDRAGPAAPRQGRRPVQPVRRRSVVLAGRQRRGGEEPRPPHDRLRPGLGRVHRRPGAAAQGDPRRL